MQVWRLRGRLKEGEGSDWAEHLSNCLKLIPILSGLSRSYQLKYMIQDKLFMSAELNQCFEDLELHLSVHHIHIA